MIVLLQSIAFLSYQSASTGGERERFARVMSILGVIFS